MKMDEYIKRSDAVKFVMKYTPHFNGNTTMPCVIGSINLVPAADVAPVIHGQWINLRSAIVDTIGNCSECGKEAVWRTRNKPYPICPNCGAKMDGKAVDEND